jgi:hypothetical protein
MNVDGLPTTIGSFLVDPFIAPTMEPPPVSISKDMRKRMKQTRTVLTTDGRSTCPLLSICKMSDCITISGYKKASWIFSDTKGGIPRKNRMVLKILYSSSLIMENENKTLSTH